MSLKVRLLAFLVIAGLIVAVFIWIGVDFSQLSADWQQHGPGPAINEFISRLQSLK